MGCAVVRPPRRGGAAAAGQPPYEEPPSPPVVTGATGGPLAHPLTPGVVWDRKACCRLGCCTCSGAADEIHCRASAHTRGGGEGWSGEAAPWWAVRARHAAAAAWLLQGGCCPASHLGHAARELLERHAHDVIIVQGAVVCTHATRRRAAQAQSDDERTAAATATALVRWAGARRDGPCKLRTHRRIESTGRLGSHRTHRTSPRSRPGMRHQTWRPQAAERQLRAPAPPPPRGCPAAQCPPARRPAHRRCHRRCRRLRPPLSPARRRCCCCCRRRRPCCRGSGWLDGPLRSLPPGARSSSAACCCVAPWRLRFRLAACCLLICCMRCHTPV